MIAAVDIAALHASRWYGSFVLAGGGAGLIAQLLAVPGASGTVADVRIPYASAAMAQYLGGTPDNAVSGATARALAMAALRQTLMLGVPEGNEPFGFALTASLRSAAPKRGAHRVHIALQTLHETRTLSVALTKDARTRADEEVLAGLLGWQMLARLAAIAGSAAPLLPGEHASVAHHAGNPAWRRLITGEVMALDFATGALPSAQPQPRLLFPGSFNPPHAGHLLMAALAERHAGMQVEYELCVLNVDKAPLDYAEIGRRASLLPADRRLWLTRAGTFLAKARALPGAMFVVGIDTLLRIAEPRFYAGTAHRDAVLAELAALGTQFIVFGRTVADRFLGLHDVELPPLLHGLSTAVPEEAFRADLSSSQLRAAAAADPDQPDGR